LEARPEHVHFLDKAGQLVDQGIVVSHNLEVEKTNSVAEDLGTIRGGMLRSQFLTIYIKLLLIFVKLNNMLVDFVPIKNSTKEQLRVSNW
jgi:hypothetical protein